MLATASWRRLPGLVGVVGWRCVEVVVEGVGGVAVSERERLGLLAQRGRGVGVPESGLGLHHPRRKDLPAVDIRHLHPAVVRPSGNRRDPRRSRTYDYHRAALDALHFPKLVDRIWQNLRRATGYQVQYFAAVEAQRRLAPHLHAAIRGAIPRDLLRKVATATYQQVWWPPFVDVIHDQEYLPEWHEDLGYVDIESGTPLPTWDQALDELDTDPHEPAAHTLRLGRQLDIQGIIAEENDADRRVAYLTKYLAKSFGDAFGDQDELSARQHAHRDRLQRELRWLPCSSRCANWLRYGVQPEAATAGLVPGHCTGKAHDHLHLGCGGRRVLVSRKWTGKTLTDHRGDRAEVVRQTLLAAGVESPEIDRMATHVVRDDGAPRFQWRTWNAHEASPVVYRAVLTRSIVERLRWQREYEAAKAHASPGERSPPSSRQPAELGVAGGGQG